MPHARGRARPAPPVCSAAATPRVQPADGARPLLDGVDLELRAGEIVAIAGVAGNGQQALAELLCGLQRAERRHAAAAGPRACPRGRATGCDAGVARIPEDRHAVGVVGDLPVWENAVLERYAQPGLLARRRRQARRGAWPMRGS